MPKHVTVSIIVQDLRFVIDMEYWSIGVMEYRGNEGFLQQ